MVESGHSHKTLQRYARSIGLKFKHTALLRRALSHSSYAYEQQPPVKNNERLEFLGDAVLGLSISHYLMLKYPEKDEGFLAKIKSIVVSEPVLARIAGTLRIGEMVLLGRGELLSGGGERPSILADTMEALLGASYLDSGFEKTKSFILKLWDEPINQVIRGELRFTYRSELQEMIQKNIKTSPDYALISETGPDNDKVFCMEVSVGGLILGRGEDRTKKGACQLAAHQALIKLHQHYTLEEAPGSIKELRSIFNIADSPDTKKTDSIFTKTSKDSQ